MACTHVFETEAYLVLVCLVRLAEQQRKPVRPLNVPLGSTCVDGMRLILVEQERELLQSNGARLRHMLVAGELRAQHMVVYVHALASVPCA